MELKANNIAIFIVLCLVAGGCKVNFHLKKSKKHYEKAIQKGYIPKIDTVYQIDSVIIPRVSFDTTFIQTHDTITITKDILSIKYYNRGDTVFLEGECKDSVIVKEIPITVQEKVYIKESFVESLMAGNVYLWAFMLIIALLFMPVIKKYVNK